MTSFRPLMTPLLAQLGIDAKRYWLLTDLFQKLSDRREILNQLGRDGVALKTITWIYFGITSLMALSMAASRISITGYFSMALGFSAFLLFTIVLSETANSLVNPAESLLLSHQPITGATYTAAKLSHLGKIVFYLATGLNAGPALAGLLKHGSWWYSALHLLSAYLLGALLALFSCAIFGLLIRFVPAPRLKAAGQVVDGMPLLVFPLLSQAGGVLEAIGSRMKPFVYAVGPAAFLLACGILVCAVIWFGLQSLSGDYLVKASAIMHGHQKREKKQHASWLGGWVSWRGGPPARGGFAYVCEMLPRDWQLRRNLIPMLPMLIGPVLLLVRNLHTSPFSGQFTPAHVLPHAFGFCLLMVCAVLGYGSDFKGAWVFQLSPKGVFPRFVRGVHAALWTYLVLLPFLILLPVFCWFWGWWQGTLFVLFSVAMASVHLALELRLVKTVPFSQQVTTERNSFLLPILLVGGMIVAGIVVLQYLILFRSAITVLVSTIVLGACAWWLTRTSLDAYTASILYHLGLEANEAGDFYKEL